MLSIQFAFTRKFKGKFRFTKNVGFIGEKRRNCRINGRIAINGRDDASLDQIPIKS